MRIVAVVLLEHVDALLHELPDGDGTPVAAHFRHDLVREARMVLRALALEDRRIALPLRFEHLHRDDDTGAQKHDGERHACRHAAPMPAHEFAGAIRQGVGPSGHRFVLEVATQVLRQQFGALIALERIFLERLGDDVVEITAQRAAVCGIARHLRGSRRFVIQGIARRLREGPVIRRRGMTPHEAGRTTPGPAHTRRSPW